MNIKQYSVHNEIKASMAERVIRTLKSKIFKCLLHNLTRRYIDALPDLVEAYNNSKHRSIGMAPNAVTAENSEFVFKTLFPENWKTSLPQHKPKFGIGDSVRVSKERLPFHKSYLATWSEEIFKIKAVLKRDPVVYKIEDHKGNEVDGVFYNQELQKINPTNIYRIENVLRQRSVKGGGKELLVKWQGYKEPTWINEKDVTSLTTKVNCQT